MPGPTEAINIDLVSTFCAMDSFNLANLIQMQEDRIEDKEIALSFNLLSETIIHELLKKVPTLEDVYPHIAKYLYADDNADKSTHKQMFWRIFGNIALANLQANLSEYNICPDCGMKIPAWSTGHHCRAVGKRLLTCIDCGIIADRTGPKQCRCEICQAKYRVVYKTKINQLRPTKKGR